LRIRRKGQRKKKKKMITITLEKDGELRDHTLKVGKKLGMLKVAKKLASEGRKGWQLRDITGDPEIAGMFMGAVRDFKITGKIPVKSMVKQAGLRSTPGIIKKLIKKDKEKKEDENEEG
jgi:hypothetical protein